MDIRTTAIASPDYIRQVIELMGRYPVPPMEDGYYYFFDWTTGEVLKAKSRRIISIPNPFQKQVNQQPSYECMERVRQDLLLQRVIDGSETRWCGNNNPSTNAPLAASLRLEEIVPHPDNGKDGEAQDKEPACKR